MRFIVTSGGTGGHINPALAVADVLLQDGHQVFFAGAPRSLEERLVGETDIPFTAFEAAGFDRSHKSTLLTSTTKLLRSTQAARRWLVECAPDAVIGFGGYVSIPVGRAAEKLGIPLVIHEQNSVCGLTNRYLASRASCIALAYPHAAATLKTTAPIKITGNPVRASIFDHTREEARATLDIPQDARLLLVFGGSQGARHLNTALVECASDLLKREDLFIIHITGPKELETVEKALTEQGVDFGGKARYRIYGYFDRMGEALAACDMTVARAGASSIAEISACGTPALLVPFPFATDDHQTTNAAALVDAGAAFMLADSEVQTARFSELLAELLDDAALRATMAGASRALGAGDAARAVADLALQAASGAIGDSAEQTAVGTDER